MSEQDYHSIYKHYESCYDKHGNKPKGFDWPNEEDLLTRFKVLSGILPREEKVSLLDLGCGSGFLIDYLKSTGQIDQVEYYGMDISEKFIQTARQNHPDFSFEQRDILKDPIKDRKFDYVIINGIFNMKIGLEYEEMWNFMCNLLKSVFNNVNCGVAFNVMSKNVAWERDDLFHVSIDELEKFMSKELTRHYVIRNDYGLYEYSTYIYKTPNR